MKNRTVIWRNLQCPGSEHCELCCKRAGWLLKGSVIAALDGARPMLAEYEVECDEDWQTLRVNVVRRIGSDSRSVRLTNDAGRWRTAEGDLPALAGCMDVDLGASPCTNTLPIRRLNLAVAQTAKVTAAWIRFPNLTIEPLSQAYTRLAPDRYRYESSTGFSAELTVDDEGLVTVYPGGWERVAVL